MGLYQKYIKRIIDVFLSVLGLILLAPLIIIIAVLVKKDDGGDIFYRGVRVGKNGELFRIYKFRTMVMNAEQLGGPSTSDDDNRITKLGKFLRSYKLDEIPQLLNVLMGDMSLVGPRPEVVEYVEQFTDEERIIVDVRPGITDWASIWNPDEGSFLAKYQDPEKAYVEILRPKKLELQKNYVKNISFSTDISIIWETMKVILTGKTTDLDDAQ